MVGFVSRTAPMTSFLRCYVRVKFGDVWKHAVRLRRFTLRARVCAAFELGLLWILKQVGSRLQPMPRRNVTCSTLLSYLQCCKMLWVDFVAPGLLLWWLLLWCLCQQCGSVPLWLSWLLLALLSRR
jgi:hypothetical protein